MKDTGPGASLRRMLFMLLGLVLLGTLGYTFLTNTSSSNSIPGMAQPTSTIRIGPLVIDAIQRNAKLETINMVITSDTTITREHGFLGACSETITYLAYYDVSAGIDLREISRENITVNNDGMPDLARVVIDLPPAQVLHTELDTEQSRLVQQDTPRWVPGCSREIADMTLEAQQVLREEARAAAKERGILSLAETHAADELKRLLNEAGYTNVEIRTWGSRMTDASPVPTVPVVEEVPVVPVTPDK